MDVFVKYAKKRKRTNPPTIDMADRMDSWRETMIMQRKMPSGSMNTESTVRSVRRLTARYVLGGIGAVNNSVCSYS